MRGLRAALFKDLKLFLSGAGALALLLPLLLLPALRMGMGDLTEQSYVRSFSIAVRDLDNTVMSRSLLTQMEEIGLFASVERLGEDDTDEEALERGAAAVVTLPRDFFYDLYTMDDCPVTIVLNEDMDLSSALFQAMFRSVMSIIRANQTAGLAAYTTAYGELTPQVSEDMYAKTSRQLILDALGRQRVFEGGGLPSEADLAGALERRLLACTLGVLALFFALSAVKTLPEELALGVLPRFRAAGGRMGPFLFSKFLAAFLLTLPALVLAGVLLPETGAGLLLAMDLLLLWAAFGLLLAVAAWSGSGAAVQRWGNLIMLISLALGGTLWPRTVLPDPLPALGKLTLPYYAALGLEGSARGLALSDALALLWPLAALGAAGMLLALPGLLRRRDGGRAWGLTARGNALPLGADGKLTAFPGRLTGLSLFKLRAAAGGLRGLAALLAVAVLCGAAAQAVRTGRAGSLRLGICDLDGSELSEELVDMIRDADGVSVTLYGPEEGRRALLTGEAEGLLTVGEGYADALMDDEQTPLGYDSASASLAAQGVREIIAGDVAVQRSRYRAMGQAEKLMGRALTEEERDGLVAEIRRVDREMPPLYTMARSDGAPVPDPFVPGQMGFAALVGLFTLLTAAAWCGSGDARQAERRMAAFPRGRLLSYGSDCLALTALGVLALLAVLLPAGGTDLLLPALAYALCAAALSLALVRLTALEGRVDALAPLLALLLCLVGGSFLDLTQLSPLMETASLFTPPGLAVRAADGSLPACAALAAEGALFFVLGMPRRK